MDHATYYNAAYTDGGRWITTCNHLHQTVHGAAACISSAGGYVVGVEDGKILALTDREETEFQNSMYGRSVDANSSPDHILLLLLLLRLGRHSL